jgi:hypothetical protein
MWLFITPYPQVMLMNTTTHMECVWSCERDSLKVNIWCALKHDGVVGPFFFAEQTVTSHSYLDMLQLYEVPQLEQQGAEVIFQHNGAPPHYSVTVREFLDVTFPQRWIGRGGWLPWPPRSPDLTPLDFYFWGYIKQCVYSVCINNIDHLKTRITEAVHSVTPDVLHRVWKELEYRLNMCKATNRSQIRLD